jgi:DNA polymerase-3 subunit gamma/tau
VEQSPGSWVVGTASNVESHTPDTSAADHAATAQDAALEEPQAPVSHAGAPAYEPAAAQAPAPQIPVHNAVAANAQAQAHDPAQTQVPPQAPAGSWATVPAPAAAEVASNGPGRQSLYQRLSNSPEALAGRNVAPARAAAATATMVEDIPSADDETIEESGVFGRAAVERILGGRLLEERSLDGTPLMRR